MCACYMCVVCGSLIQRTDKEDKKEVRARCMSVQLSIFCQHARKTQKTRKTGLFLILFFIKG